MRESGVLTASRARKEGGTRSQSIARRLVFSIIGYSFLIATFMIGVDLFILIRRADRDLERQVGLLVSEESPQLAQTLWNYDREATNLILHGIMENPSIARLRLEDEDGSVIAELEAASSRSLPREARGSAADIGRQWLFPIAFEPPGKPPRSMGNLFLWSSREAELKQVWDLLAMTIPLVLAIVAILAIIVKLTIDRVLGNPIQRIAAQLSSIETVEEGAPVLRSEKDVRAELLVITEAINEMGLRIGESERRYRSLFEDSPISLWDEDFSELKFRIDALSASGVRDWNEYYSSEERVAEAFSLIRVRDVNKATLRLLGCASKAELAAGFARFFGPESSATMRGELVALASGGSSFEAESVHLDAAGKRLFVQVALRLVPGYEDTWSRVLVSVQDLTERRRIEKALEGSEAKYRGLVEQSSEGIVLLDRSGQIVECNRVVVQAAQVDKSELLGRTIPELAFELLPEAAKSPEERERLTEVWAEAIEDCASGRPTATFESSLRGPDDTTLLIEQSLFAINSSAGFMAGAIFRDVTAQREASRALMESLREKEILLQEIHHRVKNNLQIICSLIHLESSSIAEESPVARVLSDMEARVSAMALVHDLLYASDDFARVDFSSYAKRLCSQLLSIYGDDRGRVAMRTEVEDVHLALDEAIPCGLLINELVVNSLKHAFPGERRGTIRVSMSEVEGSILLEVADDGIGAPGIDAPRQGRETIGLGLVEALASQMKAELSIEPRNGFTVSLRIPLV
jgi:PAS domain S-box